MMEGLAESAGLTLALWVCSFTLACSLSLTALFFSGPTFYQWPTRFLRALFYGLRSTPLIFQVVGFYSVSGMVWGSSWLSSAWACATFALGLNSAAYLFSAFDETRDSYPEQDSLSVSGFSPVDRFLTFELPYIWRTCRYSTLNESILLLKGTSLASLVTLHEMAGWAKSRSNETFDFWSPYLTIASVYITIYWLIRLGAKNLTPPSNQASF